MSDIFFANSRIMSQFTPSTEKQVKFLKLIGSHYLGLGFRSIRSLEELMLVVVEVITRGSRMKMSAGF